MNLEGVSTKERSRRIRISQSLKQHFAALSPREGEELGRKSSKAQLAKKDRNKVYRTPEFKAKISKAVKRHLKNNPEEAERRKMRFINAPRRTGGPYGGGPNKPEKAVIAMEIDDLEYTGAGDHWVTLKINGKSINKNPDFILRSEKGRAHKVVEVMDFVFWHSEKEAKRLVRAYAKKGIDCLIIDAKDPVKRPKRTKKLIKRFLQQ